MLEHGPQCALRIQPTHARLCSWCLRTPSLGLGRACGVCAHMEAGAPLWGSNAMPGAGCPPRSSDHFPTATKGKPPRRPFTTPSHCVCVHADGSGTPRSESDAGCETPRMVFPAASNPFGPSGPTSPGESHLLVIPGNPVRCCGAGAALTRMPRLLVAPPVCSLCLTHPTQRPPDGMHCCLCLPLAWASHPPAPAIREHTSSITLLTHRPILLSRQAGPQRQHAGAREQHLRSG